MREAPEERREADGLEALPIRHGGLPDGLVLQDVISGAETVVEQGMLFLSNLPDAGIQVWHCTGPGLYEL
jgi:alpha-glucosidase